MKLIIDIPEEEYKTGQLVKSFGCYSEKLDSVIYSGTPIESQPTDKCKGCYYNDGEVHAECVVCDKEAQPTDAKQDCEHCIHTYGTLGCCDMVNNEWVYDCDFGKEQYKKEHEAQPNSNEFFNFDAPMVKKSDAVSREAVQDLISRWLSDYLLDETREALETINYKIGDMPPVFPQRKVGKWIEVGSEDNPAEHHFECSECGQRMNWLDEYDHYCCNCGSKNWEG